MLLEKPPKINLHRGLPAGFSAVGLTVDIFGVVGFSFGVEASKSLIQMIFLHFGCVLKFKSIFIACKDKCLYSM